MHGLTKITLSIIASSLLLIVPACTSKTRQMQPGKQITKISQDIYKSEGYTLVWSDEFNIDGKPDTKNWTYEEGFVRNEEHQWYQKDNAYCKDGLLIIEAKRIDKKPSPMYDTKKQSWKHQRKYIEYTSSGMKTKGLHDWKYGRFEIRAKIDPRLGSWPAFWTIGIEGGWPSNGEIDILEYYRGMLKANAFWGGRNGRRLSIDTTSTQISSFGEGWAEEFHVYKMDWDETYIRIYVDDQLLNEIDLSETTNEDLSKGPINPLKQPHFILVNLAIGGKCGGDPNKTRFPVTYKVDYIRVYQKVK